MMIKAKDLKVGQVINLEYGDYDNWVKFEVDRVDMVEEQVLALCHCGVIHTEFAWKPNQMLEVIG